MQQLNYPLQLTFKVTTLSNDFIIADANEQTIAYVRQKMLKLIEEIQVYTNDDRAEQIYTIRANKWLDFSTTYTFTNRQELEVGRVARKGWASLWKSTYDIFDASQKNALQVREENPWAKVGDAVLGQIPGLNLLTGYLFHPTYGVSRPDGTLVARLSKVQSFFGRKFVIDKLADFKPGEEEPMILGLMMMILLERQRG